MRATKLTYNQTECPPFQQQRGCVGETTLCDYSGYTQRKVL